MTKRVLILPGDFVGPEVTAQALKILRAAADMAEIELETEEASIGGGAYEEHGTPLPQHTLEAARRADAILLGAVGGPQWDALPMESKPEKGLLRLRQELDLYANLRPARIYGDLVDASTLKKEIVDGTDLMVIRELTGGIYFGSPREIVGSEGRRTARNTMVYSESEIERIVRVGFDIASKRNQRLCSVDKANVLEVSVLWREVARKVSQDYPQIALEHLYVDNAAMQLIREPKQFDTIVTGNLFGDILSDVAAMLTGSIGMLPSASLGDNHALYEPVHGSAPDIAGKDVANPLAAILSIGMMFRYTFDRADIEDAIVSAVTEVLSTHRTPDIHTGKTRLAGCSEMGELVLNALTGAPLPRPTVGSRP